MLATTDIHGHIFDWDYFANAPFPPSGKGRSSAPLGVSRVAAIAKQVRTEKGSDSVVMLDNGDTIQGTPLTYLSAKQPERLACDEVMARAFNLVGYDAANIGISSTGITLLMLPFHLQVRGVPRLPWG